MSRKHFYITGDKNYSLVHILIILFLIGIIGTTAVLAFDPMERRNKIRDERFLSDSKNVLAAVKNFKEKEGYFPWNPTLVKSDKDFFGYSSLSLNGVGLCGVNCKEESAGPLVTKKYLDEYYLEKEFVLQSNSVGDLKIGKSYGLNASVSVCFVPLSKFAKEKAAYEGNAWVLSDNATKTLGETTSGGVCDPSSKWSSCYVCTE